MDGNVYTVSTLNNRIKNILDGDSGLQGIETRGELSNYKLYPSGHAYFTLKDADSTIRCVMFRAGSGRLKFKPESGMEVTVKGDVSVYPRDGTYQIYCNSMTQEGSGDLHKAFEKLKAGLMKEGLFDQRHKKPIPRYPDRIAVITSSAGAAVRDIIRVLGTRWPMSKVLILPVRVQGQEAPSEIVGALRYVNNLGLADVIITGRGGGSIEDLWAFNDERVARAIFESQIPVISAVGHEPDVTISDYVADLRAATPSNAAELAVPDQIEMRDAIASLNTRAREAMRRRLSQPRARLDDLRGRRVMRDPEVYIRTKRMELDSKAISAAAQSYLSAKREQFVRLAASLDALSPLKVMTRGYSIATASSGEIVKSARQISTGERIRLRLSDGELDCRVENVITEGNNDG